MQDHSVFVVAIICVFLVLAIRAKRFGIRSFLGQKKVVIDAYKNGVLYRNGAFERVLPAGVHWINIKGVKITPVEMRPQVVRLAEAATTADRRRSRLTMLMRIQVVDAGAADQCSANYRDEHLSLILAAIRKLALSWNYRDLHLRQAEFSTEGHTVANAALKASGGACISFEVLEVESLGEAPGTDFRDVGFQTH